MCCGGFWGGDLHTGLERGLEHLEIEPNGLALARRALRVARSTREKHPTNKPLFLWMHILEPHNWVATYGEPHNDDERRRNYDRALAASDAMLAEVLGAFSQRAPDPRADPLIVSADPGEGPRRSQPTESFDRPLRLADPRPARARRPRYPSRPDPRNREPHRSDADAPRLRGLRAATAPSTVDGRSLADLATGRRAPDPDGGLAFAAMIRDRSNPGGLTALIKGRWKLIIGDKPNPARASSSTTPARIPTSAPTSSSRVHVIAEDLQAKPSPSTATAPTTPPSRDGVKVVKRRAGCKSPDSTPLPGDGVIVGNCARGGVSKLWHRLARIVSAIVWIEFGGALQL